jgi:predicted metal-dependent phosphoesterase TrpH
MMKFDLHLHTRKHSPDSVSDPFQLVKRAVDIGLDGLVITEHDYLWTEDELDELREAAPSLVILAGVEITGKGGDMLCYGVTDPFALPRGIEWGKLTREVHRQGGVCVAAHPYRWGQPFDKLLREQKAEIDGVEMMSKNMDGELRHQASEFFKRHPGLARLGNSDSHELDTLGCCYTEFDAEIYSIADLVEAIRAKKCTPTVRK